MNEKQRELRRRKIHKMLEVKVWDYQNVSIHGDRFQHFVVKSAVYKLLKEAGHENVFTEIPFPNGRIADVLDTHTGHVYEIETDSGPSDEREKQENFWDYEGIQDVLVIDPTEYSGDLDSLRKDLREELII